MTKDEALKRSLEQLEFFDRSSHQHGCVWQKHLITAIREALAQSAQEPVAFVKGCNKGQWEIFPAKAYQIFEREQPLYTTPPQRPWVGLTNEERSGIEDYCEMIIGKAAFDAIEAALRSKNHE